MGERTGTQPTSWVASNERQRQTDWPSPPGATMEDERQTYTVDEAARIIGIGRNAAYEAIRRREIPVLKIGRRLVVPKVALERLLSAGGTQATNDDG
jgi:excisionase family DNA binding protein